MTSPVSGNRRKFPRVAAVFHVTYYLDGDIVPTTTENISRGGMRIATPRVIPPGKTLSFIITFRGKPLETKGRIVYVTSDRMHAGIEFENVLYIELEGSPESQGQILLDSTYIREKVLT